MKLKILVLLFLGVQIGLNGQDRKLQLSLQYSPSFSTTVASDIETEFRLSHNVFVTGGYRLGDGSQVTLGLGWLMTGDKIELDLGIPTGDGQDRVELAYSYNYAVLPLGLIYNFGPIFIHPEVGIAFNFTNRLRRTVTLANGDVFREREEYDPTFPEFNRWTIPAFLTVGYELPLKQSVLLVGLKGYYSLNRLFNDDREMDRYLGVGLLVGYRL